MLAHILSPLALASLAILAEAPPPASPPSEMVEMMSLGQMVLGSGAIGVLVVLLAAVGVLLTILLFFQIRMQALAPMTLQRALERAIRDDDASAAVPLATASPSLLGSVVSAGLHMRSLGLDEMLANVERAAAKEAMRLGNRIANLSRLGGTTLLFGFLGSGLGFLMLLQIAGADPDAVQAGEMLLSSAVGISPIVLSLMGAILCYGAFFVFDYTLTRRAIKVREMAEEMVYLAAERADRVR